MTGIGAGIGFYYGWKDQKDVDEKLKNDPKFKEEKKKELREYIKDLLILMNTYGLLRRIIKNLISLIDRISISI